MLEKLQNLSVAKYSIDQLVELSAMAKLLWNEYKTHKVNVPDWLVQADDSLRTELKGRLRDELMRRKLEIERGLEQLKTASEKKSDLRKELDEIETQLS